VLVYLGLATGVAPQTPLPGSSTITPSPTGTATLNTSPSKAFCYCSALSFVAAILSQLTSSSF